MLGLDLRCAVSLTLAVVYSWNRDLAKAMNAFWQVLPQWRTRRLPFITLTIGYDGMSRALPDIHNTI
jgi:hypothetical protein